MTSAGAGQHHEMTQQDSATRPSWPALLASLGVPAQAVGIVVVDHGSRVAQSNDLLVEFAQLFARQSPAGIVEPAHMELAEPSIATAFRRCVARGARVVIVSPFFLLPGKHWNEDIPRLTAAAAGEHHGVCWLVAPPLGLHPLLPEIMLQRIEQSVLGRAAPADSAP